MIPVNKALTSTVGKKLVMAVTGLGLVLFTIIHLLGNIQLYEKDGTSFNLYAHTLESYGLLLTIAEVGLLAAFLIHVAFALSVKKRNLDSRPSRYRVWRSKGGPSLANGSSLNMAISGVLLLAFLVLHVLQFRFELAAPGGAEPVTTINGVQMDDLHSIVTHTFHNPAYVFIYVAAMLMLAMHLRHGFWSAFQSLGAMNSRWHKPLRGLGFFLAFALSVGFLFIPIWIYFDIGGALK